MRKRAQAGYRWFDHLIVQTPDGHRKFTWRHNRNVLDPLINPPLLTISLSEGEQYQELKKTTEERICLNVAFEAVNRMLKKYSQSQMHFRQKMVHILPDNEDVRTVLQAHAIAELGQVCMIRQELPEMTLFIAVHELMHLASFGTLFLNMTLTENGEPENEPNFIMRRNGFGFVSEDQSLFSVLNEAITEMLSKEVRQSIPNKGKISTIADLERMNNECDGEMSSQAIVLAICSRLINDHGLKRGRVRQMLIEDYLTGTHYFLQALYRHWPEAAITLSRLEKDPLSIAEAAERLKFPALADMIRFVNHKRRKKS